LQLGITQVLMLTRAIKLIGTLQEIYPTTGANKKIKPMITGDV